MFYVKNMFKIYKDNSFMFSYFSLKNNYSFNRIEESEKLPTKFSHHAKQTHIKLCKKYWNDNWNGAIHMKIWTVILNA